MVNENLTPERPSEEKLMAREEQTRKALKTVRKAVFMRVLVTVLLVWIVLRTSMQLWVVGMMVFVLIVNLSGLLPLIQEWRRCRTELNNILKLYE